MKHPNQATLALHAGGDLGFFARWRTERHLAQCESCRDEMAVFEGIREALPELSEMPEIQWNRPGGGNEGQYPAGPGGRRVRAKRRKLAAP